MTQIEGVGSEHVEMYWPHVVGWVSAAVRDAAPSWTAADVRARLDDRTMQLWVLWTDSTMTGVIVTEIYDTARGKTCALPVVGGEGMESSLDALVTIEAWAKEQGCTRLQGEGRIGWARVLRPYGWSRVSEQVEKVL